MMGLKQLDLEEEPSIDVSTTELVIGELVVSEPELPEEYTIKADLERLEQAAAAMEAIHYSLACEGMCLESAREIEKHLPNFIARSGGTNTFTSKPSLEGLAEGVQVVKKRLMEIIATVRKYVSDLFGRFKAWLIARFSKPEAQQVQEEVAQFVAKRQNREAMKFMADLPDDPEKAAYEIATHAQGDYKAFSTELVNQLGGLDKAMAGIEEQLTKNPVHFRLATGVISVQELFKEEANSSINQMLKKATSTADVAMKTRDYAQFKTAIEAIDTVAAELTEFEKAMVIDESANPQQGEGNSVRLDKLFDNINTAADDLTRVDIKSQVNLMTGALEDVVRVSADTKIEDILEMIPEDVPAEQQSVMAQKIASLYRRIGKLGSDLLKLWKMRSDQVASLNSIGNSLIGLVTSFEKAVIAAGANLTPEQKEALTKSLGDKGFSISF